MDTLLSVSYLILQIEAEYLAAARSKNPKRPIGMEHLPEAAPASTNALLAFKNKKNKKRKKLGEEPALHAVAGLPPPPLPPQPAMLFMLPPDLEHLLTLEDGLLQLPPRGDVTRCRARVGRGGRLIMDRCRPMAFDHDGLGGVHDADEDVVKPLHQLPNPYAEWSGRGDLAHAAAVRMEGRGGTVVRFKVTGAAAGTGQQTDGGAMREGSAQKAQDGGASGSAVEPTPPGGEGTTPALMMAIGSGQGTSTRRTQARSGKRANGAA
jgi:hypothetical protein